AAQRCGSRLPAGGDRLVRRRRHQQLHLEPAVDLSPRERALRLPGIALFPRRAARLCGEPGDPDDPRRAWARRDRLAGDRDRPGDAGELHRQQALVVSETALRRSAAVVVAIAGLVLVANASAAAPFTQAKPRLTEKQATALFLADDKVADWLDRYPPKRRS